MRSVTSPPGKARHTERPTKARFSPGRALLLLQQHVTAMRNEKICSLVRDGPERRLLGRLVVLHGEPQP